MQWPGLSQQHVPSRPGRYSALYSSGRAKNMKSARTKNFLFALNRGYGQLVTDKIEIKELHDTYGKVAVQQWYFN